MAICAELHSITAFDVPIECGCDSFQPDSIDPDTLFKSEYDTKIGWMGVHSDGLIIELVFP